MRIMKATKILTFCIVLIVYSLTKIGYCSKITTKGRKPEQFNKQTAYKSSKKAAIKGEYPPDYDLPDPRYIHPEQLRKDLAAILKIRTNLETVNNDKIKTKDELLVFLNSHETMPDGNLFQDASRNNSSILNLLPVMGLPNTFNNLSVIQIVSKVGLSVLLWGNPVVGAVGSAVLSIAFNQVNNSLSAAEMERAVNEFYNNVYNQNNVNAETIPRSNNIPEKTVDVDNLKLTLKEFHESVNREIISQRSLKMLSLRFKNLKIEKDIDTQQNIFKNYKLDAPIHSPLSMQSELHFTNHKSHFTSIVRN